jgi:hypothetical protein
MSEALRCAAHKALTGTPPDVAAVHYYRGNAEAARGDAIKARVQWQKASEADIGTRPWGTKADAALRKTGTSPGGKL